jgi:peptidyl-Lys metalloendopeptidase
MLLLIVAATLSGYARDAHVVAFITAQTQPEITLAVVTNDGDDIVLRVTMVNRDSKVFPLLRWNLPGDGELTNALFELSRNGKPVPYRGKMVKRSVSEKDYLQLKPGEERSAMIALAQGYDTKPKGTYKIRYHAWNQYSRETTMFPC